MDTYFLNLLSTLGSGVPMMSCILAIWSTSLEPGNSGCKLKVVKQVIKQTIHKQSITYLFYFDFAFRMEQISLVKILFLNNIHDDRQNKTENTRQNMLFIC